MSTSEAATVDTGPGEATKTDASNIHSLQQAVHARRDEYTQPHRIRVKVATWNVAACPGTDKDLAAWFVSGKGLDARLASLDLAHNSAVERDTKPKEESKNGSDTHPPTIHLVGGDKIGLYVLGLQEVIDLNSATTQVMKHVYAADHGPMERWRTAMESAVPEGYQLVASEQLSGLLLLIYASPEVAATISNASTVSVGTGLFGVMGNKGAVATRLILGETTKLVFINSHLASGHDAAFLDRRIWDVNQILSRAEFAPITIAGVTDEQGDKIGAEDFAFWFGDLNFRVDGLLGDDIRRLLTLHTKGEYDLSRTIKAEDSLEEEGVVIHRDSESTETSTVDHDSTTTSSTDQTEPENDDISSLPDPDDFSQNPHDDPASLQATLDSLLPHDQLLRMMRERKVFQDGWQEGPITFLPSYKYDVGTVGVFDTSEKRRAPSWCDRVLFRTRRKLDEYKAKVHEEEEARKRDEEMKARGIDHATDDDEVLFDYDPDKDGDDQQAQEPAGYDYDEYNEDDDEGLVVTHAGAVDRLHLEIYTSHQRVTSSDHKPVISVFTLDYDAVVPDLKAKVHAEVARELDRAENEGRPVITVVVDSPAANNAASPEGADSDRSVDFKEVRYLQRKAMYLTLANTGRVPAVFSFVDKPSSGDLETGTSSWLNSSFVSSETHQDGGTETLGKEVTLQPGETAKAKLEVMVNDISLVQRLNDGRTQLEDVLVLRVTEGRDHFVPIRASWCPTFLGRSVEELIRVPDGGITTFAQGLAEKAGRAGAVPSDLDVRCAAPKELFKLTDSIESLTDRALADAQMLQDQQIPGSPGWPFEESTWKYVDREKRDSHILKLVEALDSDKPIADAFLPEVQSLERLEIVSEVLLLFLRSLTDGIVTASVWARIELATLPSISQPAAASKPFLDHAAEDDKTAVLDLLATAPNHNISFVFLTTALAKVVAELSPISQSQMEALKTNPTAGLGGLGRRSLSFRRNGSALAAGAAMAREARNARRLRVAELFGTAVCRAQAPEKEKDRKGLEDRQRALLRLFLARHEEH